MNPEDPFPFPTETESLRLAGKEFSIRHVTDVDSLFTQLLELPDSDPAVKDEQIPYWAEVWPSAIALSEFLLEHPDTVAGKQVVEIGCGLGLPGIAAGKMTDRVLLTDYLETPLRLAEHNWRLNHSSPCDTRLLDWRSGVEEMNADVIVASDIAYERRMFGPLMTFFDNRVHSGATVIISEPDRHFARDFFRSLHQRGWQTEQIESRVHRKGIDYRINIHVLRSCHYGISHAADTP